MAITASVLATFAVSLLWLDLPERGAVTVSFLTLTQLFQVFNMRDDAATFLNNDVTRNPYVWLALALCAALLLAAVYLPVLSTVLVLEPPGAPGWAVIAGFSNLPLLAVETARRLWRPGKTPSK